MIKIIIILNFTLYYYLPSFFIIRHDFCTQHENDEQWRLISISINCRVHFRLHHSIFDI